MRSPVIIEFPLFYLGGYNNCVPNWYACAHLPRSAALSLTMHPLNAAGDPNLNIFGDRTQAEPPSCILHITASTPLPRCNPRQPPSISKNWVFPLLINNEPSRLIDQNWDQNGNTVDLLLTNINGEAKPGRLFAIMGPSGLGNATLLNVLAGPLATSPCLHLTGYFVENGQPRSSRGFKIAYVRQEDLFFSQMMVRETLSLAVELQLPNRYG